MTSEVLEDESGQAKYRAQAEEQYGSDDCEIDENAVVSIGEGGAFVAAWVWVADK